MGPFELLQNIVEILERLQVPYLITGSVAAMAYGESRLTNDIDIVADIKEGSSRTRVGKLSGFLENRVE